MRGVNKIGYCYVAHVHSRPPDPDHIVVKIGRSINPASRFRDLRHLAWNGPHRMEIAECADRGVEAELYMHQALSDFRMHGEWFYLPKAKLEKQKRMMADRFKTRFYDINPWGEEVAHEGL